MLFNGNDPIKRVFYGSRPIARIYKGSLLMWANGRKYGKSLMASITRIYGTAQKHAALAKAPLSSATAVAATAIKRAVSRITSVAKATTGIVAAAQAGKIKELAGILLSTQGLSGSGGVSKQPMSAQGDYQTGVAFGAGSTNGLPALAAIHMSAGISAKGTAYYIHDVALWPVVITGSITVTAAVHPITLVGTIAAAITAAALSPATRMDVVLKAALPAALAAAATAKKNTSNGGGALKTIASITAKGRSGGKQIHHGAALLFAIFATAADLTGNGSLLLENTLPVSAAATEATAALGATAGCAMVLSITANVSAWEAPAYNAETKDLSITQVYSAEQVGSILSIN